MVIQQIIPGQPVPPRIQQPSISPSDPRLPISGQETRSALSSGMGSGRVVDPEVNTYVSLWKTLLPGYPEEFYIALARQNAIQSQPLTNFQITHIATSFGGIDQAKLASILNRGATAGGTGVNKANVIRSFAATISDTARQLGITLSAEQITALATTAQAQNFTADQIVDELTKNVGFYGLGAGTIKTSFEKFKTTATQYLVKLNDATLQDWALRIARGETTEDTVLQYIREQAKIAMPWLSTYIDQGMAPTDVLASNRDYVARMLEVDPISLDLMDNKTLNLMTTVDETGQRTLADQNEMIKNVRRDERWKNTGNAKDLASGMGQMLAQIFGKSAF